MEKNAHTHTQIRKNMEQSEKFANVSIMRLPIIYVNNSKITWIQEIEDTARFWGPRKAAGDGAMPPSIVCDFKVKAPAGSPVCRVVIKKEKTWAMFFIEGNQSNCKQNKNYQNGPHKQYQTHVKAAPTKYKNQISPNTAERQKQLKWSHIDNRINKHRSHECRPSLHVRTSFRFVNCFLQIWGLFRLEGVVLFTCICLLKRASIPFPSCLQASIVDSYFWNNLAFWKQCSKK